MPGYSILYIFQILLLGIFGVLGVRSLYFKRRQNKVSIPDIEVEDIIDQPLDVVLLPLQQELVRNTMKILAHFPPNSRLKLDATMDNFNFDVKTPPCDENLLWN